MRSNDDKIKILIHRLGLKYNLRDEVIKKIVTSPYKFTREKISSLEIDDIETEEQFNKLKTNFIYVHIGKLYTNYRIFNKLKKQKDNLKEKWENKKI
jgi:hypothetical protein